MLHICVEQFPLNTRYVSDTSKVTGGAKNLNYHENIHKRSTIHQRLFDISSN